MRLTRNQLYSQGYRGFKSLSLRHKTKAHVEWVFVLFAETGFEAPKQGVQYKAQADEVRSVAFVKLLHFSKSCILYLKRKRCHYNQTQRYVQYQHPYSIGWQVQILLQSLNAPKFYLRLCERF